MKDSSNIDNTKNQATESSFAPKDYPEEAKLLLNALFGEFTNCFLEVRLIKGKSVFQKFYSSISAIQWEWIRAENSQGYNCYFGTCLRKTRKGDKLSVASISALWADLDAKDFPGGKSEVLSQLQRLPPYLYPSIIVDTGHGYHPYWLLREAELIESPQDILRLEAYIKGLAVTLHSDSTSDLSRVLRLPGLLNQKDINNPCLTHITHWESERRFTPLDFGDYQEEIREGKPKGAEEAKKWPERSDEFNELAIEKLLENCAFIQHCRDNASTLTEPFWWSMVHNLAVLGEPGRKKIHELSKPYPHYAKEETDKKIKEAEKVADKEVGPHTCLFIEQGPGFDCPKDCQAKKLGVKAPAGLASILAAQELRGPYLYHDKSGWHLNIEKLVDDLLTEYSFKTMRDNEECLIYEDGFYALLGEATIKEECEKRVPKKFLTTHNVNEVIGHIKRSTYADRKKFNKEKWVLNLENGLFDIQASELSPHTPEFLSTIRIPVAYDSSADYPRVKQFFREVHSQDDIPVIEELFGYSLIPDYSIQRAFLFIGDGANGKSTELELLKHFLGKANCAHISLQAIENHRFTVASLFGKLVNLYADIPSTSMRHVGLFKMLTGGDTINAEKKFKDAFSFVNYARLIFSTNKPPKVDEDTLAFWRRWNIIDFPNKFVGSQADTGILEKLTTQEELSGLLNVALQGLKRLLSQHTYSYQPSPDEVATRYLKAADSVYAFVEDMCDVNPDAWISKDELYDAFCAYCRAENIPLKGKEGFGRALKNATNVHVTQRKHRIGGDEIRGWGGIGLRVEPGAYNKVGPDKPDVKSSMKPCAICGSTDFWLRPDGRMLCNQCHPKPK